MDIHILPPDIFYGNTNHPPDNMSGRSKVLSDKTELILTFSAGQMSDILYPMSSHDWTFEPRHTLYHSAFCLAKLVSFCKPWHIILHTTAK